MKKFTLSSILFVLISTSLMFAQRRGDVTYTNLANRAATPNFFLDAIVIPGDNPELGKLVFIFRMDNSFLPFKKLSIDDEIQAPENAEFYSMARLNTEIFEGKVSKKQLKNISPVSRDLWQDTLFVETYDDTKSKKKFASGRLVTELKPGMYNYVLQLSLMEETNDRNSQRRNIKIKNFAKSKEGEIYLIKANRSESSLELINMGSNVLYGEDYQALIRIPDFSPSESYQ